MPYVVFKPSSTSTKYQSLLLSYSAFNSIRCHNKDGNGHIQITEKQGNSPITCASWIKGCVYRFHIDQSCMVPAALGHWRLTPVSALTHGFPLRQ